MRLTQFIDAKPSRENAAVASFLEKTRRGAGRSAGIRSVLTLRSRGGFSLLEMLVASAILVIIMLGLLGMFYQTDRALRLTLQQRDILDAGRTAMEVMVRDLSMVTAAENTNAANLLIFANYPGLIQRLNESNPNEVRTNTLQSFFFLTQENDIWNGIRYDFKFEANDTVGTLYRMQITDMATNVVSVSSNLLNVSYQDWEDGLAPDFAYGRISEGVVHLTLRCYDANGYLITEANTLEPGVVVVRSDDVYGYQFVGTNMPAFVDLEFGVLEPNVFRVASEMNDPVAAESYLSDKADAVQLFRKRVPVRYTPPETFRMETF